MGWILFFLMVVIVGLVMVIYFQTLSSEDLKVENKVLRDLIEDLKTKF